MVVTFYFFYKKRGSVEHQTATDAELGSTADILAQVQWKAWQR